MKKRNLIIFAGLIVAVSVIFKFKAIEKKHQDITHPKKGEINRVVSLLPSVTETLYALGAGDKVVGVTRYCAYPPEAKTKPKVGGLLDPNFEKILDLNPDLVILSKNNSAQRDGVLRLGIPILEVETRTVPGVLEYIELLGDRLNQETEASRITSTIRNRIAVIRQKTKGSPKPKVLVTFDRTVGEGDIKQVYIAGNHTFFNDLINIVGGVNAFQGNKTITSPIVTPEGIFEMDPDIIIETMNMLNHMNMGPDEVIKDWDALPDLRAYKNKRIYVFNQDYIDVPGPRLSDILDILAKTIHPEIDWSNY